MPLLRRRLRNRGRLLLRDGRVARLEDTLKGKIKAWSEPERRQSKRIKDLADIARLVETHPPLWERLPDVLRTQIQRPE